MIPDRACPADGSVDGRANHIREIYPRHSTGLPYMPVNVGIYASPMECLGYNQKFFLLERM